MRGRELGGTSYVSARVAVLGVTLATCAKVLTGATYAVSRALWMQRTGLPHIRGATLEGWQVAQLVDHAAWLALGLAFAFWMRRFVRNSWSLSNAASVARSQWTGFFMAIPLLCLVFPAMSLNHCWYSAHEDETPASPDWPRMPAIIVAWWATYVGAAAWSVVGPGVLVWIDGGVTLIPLVEVWLDSVALFLLWRIVTTVSQRQAAQRQAGRHESQRPPLPAGNGRAAAA